MSDEHHTQALLTVNGQGLKQLVKVALAWLHHHQQAINALNVFPVPDGDTGTNMLLTMQSAWAEIEQSPETHVGKVAHNLAHGALMGARGNSGVILSQLWRGFARSLADQELLNVHNMAQAMQEGADTAYKGVVKPVEGTILTVAREIAKGCAEAVQDTDDMTIILERMVTRGKEAVARTPNQLPLLKQAGVVDAGGQGYFIILEGMLRGLRGETVEFDSALAGAVDLHAPAHIEAGDVEGGYIYDVQFVVIGQSLDAGAMREAISAMGPSALIVGEPEAIKVHVHVADPGVPLSYAAALGSLRDVVVEDMQAQYQEFIMGRAAAPVIAPELNIVPDQVATVVVAPGNGLARVFHSLGTSVIIPGGQTMNPSTEQFVQALKSLPTERAILLPNNSNVVMTARQAAELVGDKQVRVIPTHTIPQGIAAQLAFNPHVDLEDNVAAMQAAATRVQTGEVTIATRAVEINGLQVDQGQAIGLLDDHLVATGQTIEGVVWQLIERMNSQAREIITLYYGDAVSSMQAQALAEAIRQHMPELTVEVVEGGQPHYQYILSVE
ncbi:MAG: DAK2 domain-containing protein [Thermoflexales bacterium]|nr:DAK2 domain-containing protein [Thermoflexales bacterium]